VVDKGLGESSVMLLKVVAAGSQGSIPATMPARATCCLKGRTSRSLILNQKGDTG
jgi:hypothetical protein